MTTTTIIITITSSTTTITTTIIMIIIITTIIIIIIIIIIITITLKGTLRDILQSLHFAVYRLQHVCSSGAGAILCKPCATFQVIIMCNMCAMLYWWQARKEDAITPCNAITKSWHVTTCPAAGRSHMQNFS